MTNENGIEKEIQDKGLNAPRLSPELIDAAIVESKLKIVIESTDIDVAIKKMLILEDIGNRLKRLGIKVTADELTDAAGAEKPHVKCMRQEHEELSEKVKKLQYFISTDPKYNFLSEAERAMMNEQRAFMDGYLGVLALRIKAAQS